MVATIITLLFIATCYLGSPFMIPVINGAVVVKTPISDIIPFYTYKGAEVMFNNVTASTPHFITEIENSNTLLAYYINNNATGFTLGQIYSDDSQ